MTLVSHGAMLQETSEWNGITTKRKGQKWGTEKQPASSWKDSRAYKAHSSGSWAARKQLPGVDFEKLVPLIDLPKVWFLCVIISFLCFMHILFSNF